MRLLRRFAPCNDNIVYRITYNVYHLNTVTSQKLIQGISRGRIPLEYHDIEYLKLKKANYSKE